MRPCLYIIPARTGSQRIPHKNFTPLAGASPLVRAIQCCSPAPGEPVSTDMIVVTSNCVQTLEGMYWPGVHWHRAEAPLHTDGCSMVAVVLDVLQAFPGPPEQSVLLVQPTQPLRTPTHLSEARSMLATGCRSVVSLAETEPADKLYYVTAAQTITPVALGVERAQDARRTYYCDGTVYGFLRGWFEQHQTFRHPVDTRPLFIEPEQTCRLDTPHDWAMAKLQLRSQQVYTTQP